MRRIASGKTRRAEFVFVDVIAVRMMQMTVVRVIDVIVMQYRDMPASRSVHVLVPIMDVFFHEAFRNQESLPSAACCKPLRINSTTCVSARA